MALYTTLRIYEVPAKDRIEATDRMLEALEQGVEKDYHVKDIVRAPGTRRAPGRGCRWIHREAG